MRSLLVICVVAFAAGIVAWPLSYRYEFTVVSSECGGAMMPLYTRYTSIQSGRFSMNWQTLKGTPRAVVVAQSTLRVQRVTDATKQQWTLSAHVIATRLKTGYGILGFESTKSTGAVPFSQWHQYVVPMWFITLVLGTVPVTLLVMRLESSRKRSWRGFAVQQR